MQITISPKEEAARGGRLRSRLAQSAIRETLGSSGGPQRKSYVMEPPLRASACSDHALTVLMTALASCIGQLSVIVRSLNTCWKSDGNNVPTFERGQ